MCRTILPIKEGFITKCWNNMFKFMLIILGAVGEIVLEPVVEWIREGISKVKRYNTKTGQPIGHTSRAIPAADFAKLIGFSGPNLFTFIKTHGR